MKKSVLLILFLFSMVEGAIPVLVYHGIIKNGEDVISNFDISESNFALHMEALKKAGYQTITLNHLLMYLKKEKSLPGKPFMITFDDGRKDSLLADPVLKKLGFTAIMFVITDPEQLKLSQRLNWDEMNEMFQSKTWEMQAHGHLYHNLIVVNEKGDKGHFASNKMWLAEKNRLENDLEYQMRLLEDLQTNKREIEGHIHSNNVIAFAFPFGDYGLDGYNVPDTVGIPVSMQNVHKLFSLAFILYPIFFQTERGDFMVHEDTNAFLLPRFVDTGFLSGEDLVKIFDKAAKL